MRILFVNDFGYPFGGAEIYAKSLAEALARRGHEVRWLTSDARRGPGLFHLAAASPFHRDHFCGGTESRFRPRRAIQQFVNPGAAVAAARIVRGWKPDVVHLHGFLGQLSPAVLLAFRGTPLVATAHTYKLICPRATKLRSDGRICKSPFGSSCALSRCLSLPEYLHERAKRAVWGGLYGELRLLIAPSRHVKRVMEAECPVPVRVVPNGTDIHELRRPKRNGARRLLFAGRLVSQKGVDVLIRVLPPLRERFPELTLFVAGNGPEEPALRRLALGLGVADSVRFLGHVDREGLAALHAETDLLAAPALWPEPLPMTVLESLALGTPVVASDLGGHGDVVVPGGNGLLVPPGDESALESAIAAILGDGELRRRLEAEAARGAERFRLAGHAEELERIYDEVRTERRRSAVPWRAKISLPSAEPKSSI